MLTSGRFQVSATCRHLSQICEIAPAAQQKSNTLIHAHIRTSMHVCRFPSLISGLASLLSNNRWRIFSIVHLTSETVPVCLCMYACMHISCTHTCICSTYAGMQILLYTRAHTHVYIHSWHACSNVSQTSELLWVWLSMYAFTFQVRAWPYTRDFYVDVCVSTCVHV